MESSTWRRKLTWESPWERQLGGASGSGLEWEKLFPEGLVSGYLTSCCPRSPVAQPRRPGLLGSPGCLQG